MKAMIFAAGLGTRLKPITDTMPKAMVPIAGKPLLQHIILKLKNAGFDEIIINVHHFADQIISFLLENNNFGIRIEISDESENLLETGGGIKKAAWFFDDGKPFLVHNVDILSNLDLKQLYLQNTRSKKIASLVVSSRHTSRYLLFDKQNNLKAWINTLTNETKPPVVENIQQLEKLAFSGIHVISPQIFDWMGKWDGKFSIIDFYLSIVHEQAIEAYAPDNLNLLDVGKVDSLKEAELFLLSSQAF